MTRMERIGIRVGLGLFLLGAVGATHNVQATDETPTTKWKNVWGVPDCTRECDLTSNWCKKDPDNCDCDC